MNLLLAVFTVIFWLTGYAQDYPSKPVRFLVGFGGFEATAPWVGLLAPAGTPAVIVIKTSGVKPE